jgi:hypothetical protein
MLITRVVRQSNGDIKVDYYCKRKEEKNEKNEKKRIQKRLTHDECKNNNVVIYKNGEGYALKISIHKENLYPNLIGCWCNNNLRFQNEEELLKHVEGKTHPEEFQD